MNISQIEALQIAKTVNKILHIPGNYNGGILEMAVVIDTAISREDIMQSIKEIITALKKNNSIFNNVRLNFIHWKSDIDMISEVVPLSFMQSGLCFGNYQPIKEEKHPEYLYAYLKKFHARSKIVLIIVDKAYIIEDKEKAKESMTPFLKQKLLEIGNGYQISGTQLFLKIVQ